MSEDSRFYLVQHLESSAEWRSRKAEEFPGDERNAQSAVALSAAARDVASLPDSDPRLARLDRFYKVNDEDATDALVEVESLLIGRHGFGPKATQTTGQLLEALLREADEVVVQSLDMRLELQDDDGS
jgi:hypothetical protein